MLLAGLAVTGAAAFGACASTSGRASAASTSDEALTDTVYDEEDVENRAFQLTEYGAPRIPRGIDLQKPARVVVTFVIDTTGRALSKTFKVIESDHPALTQAVREALPAMRFIPARLKTGRAVRQLVQLPFVFSIR